MPELTSEIVEEVVKTCESAVGEAAEAFSRSFDIADAKLALGEPGNVELKTLGEQLDGPGLAIVFTVGDSAAILILPETADIVPQWCVEPDPTGKSKLQTLAQELGITLLPEEFMATDSAAGWVSKLSEAVGRAGVGDGAAMLPLELSAANAACKGILIWPASDPAAVLKAEAAADEQSEGDIASEKPEEEKPPAAEQQKPDIASSATKTPPKPAKNNSDGNIKLNDLPDYSRSLLKIQVPVVVTLAEKRQPLNQIVELAPGSIIHFEKSCEEMLDLEISGNNVATGEAVKIGDKFGLRLTSMVLPDERFTPVAVGN